MLTPPATASAARPFAVLPILLSVGCVGSQVPLTAPEDGFVDTTIVGTWREEDGALEALDEEFIRVSIDDGTMTITTDFLGACSTADVYAAHSSLLEGRKYLNLRFVRCAGGAENGQWLEDCPYYIVRYATEPDFPTLRDEVGAEAYSELAALQESAIEPLALFNVGDPDYVGSAIETRVVEGCATCTRRDVPCLAARPRALRRFFTKHAGEIFPLNGWSLWRRVDPAAAAP